MRVMRMVRLGQTYQGAMMAKNAKKNRSKALQKATSKGANHPKQAQKPQNSPDPQVQGDANAEVTAPVERCESLPPMDLHTRMGILDDEIYTQLIEPAFQAFALEDEETGLRMLAESVVSAIAAREDYAKFRKLDDICQRYLYYIERLYRAQTTNARTRRNTRFVHVLAKSNVHGFRMR